MSAKTETKWYCDRCECELLGDPLSRRPGATLDVELRPGSNAGGHLRVSWAHLCGVCTSFVFDCVRINIETGEGR